MVQIGPAELAGKGVKYNVQKGGSFFFLSFFLSFFFFYSFLAKLWRTHFLGVLPHSLH